MKKTTINYIRFKQELLQLNKIALRPLLFTTTDQVALCILIKYISPKTFAVITTKRNILIKCIFKYNHYCLITQQLYYHRFHIK